MKIYRTVGSILGAFLTLLVIVVLCATLFLYSTANLLTEKTLANIVNTSMRNEQIQNLVTDMLAESLQEQLSKNGSTETLDKTQLKDTVSELLENPAMQDVISDVISGSVSEITSGSFDGELNIEEKLSDALTSNPDVLENVTSETLSIMMSDDAMREFVAQAPATKAILGELDDETMNQILDDPEVQELVSKVVSHIVSASLTGEETEPIDIASKVSALIAKKPALFEEAIQTYIPDEESKAALLAEASQYASTVGAPPPEANISDIDLARYLIDLHKDEFNEQFNASLAGTSVDMEDIDYTDFAPTEELTTTPNSPSGASISFDGETVALLNELSVSLAFFRSAAFLFVIIAIFLLLYLLTALLTWNFRYPLIFNGVASLLTGLLLIFISVLPVSDILTAGTASDDMSALVSTLIASVWGALSDQIMLIGTGCLVLGIILIAAFIITEILIKNKMQ